ncbi:MAG: hypothetical protein H0X34_06535 [Chthoniobacterales bacterium]|nr:hypothetical protein [Chthoniobacterales bacterium]MBA3831538.1 hypothetical protein [Chthoniobacterales bacterium]
MPDSGTTAMLLGSAFTGLGLLRCSGTLTARVLSYR